MAETQELPHIEHRLGIRSSKHMFSDLFLDSRRKSSNFSHQNAAMLMQGNSTLQILIEDNKKSF